VVVGLGARAAGIVGVLGLVARAAEILAVVVVIVGSTVLAANVAGCGRRRGRRGGELAAATPANTRIALMMIAAFVMSSLL